MNKAFQDYYLPRPIKYNDPNWPTIDFEESALSKRTWKIVEQVARKRNIPVNVFIRYILEQELQRLESKSKE